MQVYLLAAGEGRRSGGPKAWRRHEGKTLLERQLEFLLSRFAAPKVAVTIQEGWRRRCETINPGVRWIAEDPSRSALSALQTLLRACPQQDWAFLYHVDMPVWEPAVFERLAQAAPGDAEAVVPMHAGRKGHPLLLSPTLGAIILALNPTQDRLDYWLRTRRISAVDLPYSCVLENWNTAQTG